MTLTKMLEEFWKNELIRQPTGLDLVTVRYDAPKIISKLQKQNKMMYEVLKELDCTCGSESHSDYSYISGGCIKHETLIEYDRISNE